MVRRVLRLEGMRKPGEITVSLLSDGQIRELNTLYLGRYCPTDVISFDISRTNKELVADIAVSTETAMRNAKIYHTRPLAEVYLYVIHGLLHLLGYNDSDTKKRKRMEMRTRFILSSLKV